MFKRTTAVNKILQMKARKRVIQGGTSAGKTYAIIPVLINRALLEPRLKITIIAETLPAVKEGALDIFTNILFDTERWNDSNWNASSLTYTFKNGSRIQFKSFDSVGKAKSSGKRDILFINEANGISFDIADALMIRSKETYIDYNPDREFWVHKEVLPEHNSEFLLLTFEDNEALPDETLEDLLIKKNKAFHNSKLPNDLLFKDGNVKNEYWANWWRVYGLGEVGSLMGVVFSNWSRIDEIPKEAKLLGYGMDFGFTNDPSTLVAIYQYNGKYILDELIYQKGLINSELANIMKPIINRDVVIYADSAEPKTIKDLSLYGFRITGADKGADSIMFGISKMQEESFLVTNKSVNLISELESYTWQLDKNGATLNRPIDNNNHAIDAIRYFFTNKGKYNGKY